MVTETKMYEFRCINAKGITSVFCLTKDEGYFTVQLGSQSVNPNSETTQYSDERYVKDMSLQKSVLC